MSEQQVQCFSRGRGSVKLNVLLDSQTFIGTGKSKGKGGNSLCAFAPGEPQPPKLISFTRCYRVV